MFRMEGAALCALVNVLFQVKKTGSDRLPPAVWQNIFVLVVSLLSTSVVGSVCLGTADMSSMTS